jgi:DsbC/DsbD-like thiol-disulfide interchange protein
VVEAKMVMATDVAHSNSTVQVAVVAQVAPGYHINDYKPRLEYLIPTELKLEPPEQVAVKQIVYPKGIPERFAFSDMPLSVYEGTVVVGVALEIARAVRPGTFMLKGKLAYQACNDHACLPPASVPVRLPIQVVPRRVPLKRVHTDVFDRIQIE